MSEKTRSPRRTAEQWRTIVERQSQSSLSSAAFCQSEGIAYQSFMNWRKKLGKNRVSSQSTPEPGFIELTSADELPVSNPSSWTIELDLAPGVQLRIAR